MRYMRSYLAEQFDVIPTAKQALLLALEVKILWKSSKIYSKIFEFKVFEWSNHQSNRFDLAA